MKIYIRVNYVATFFFLVVAEQLLAARNNNCAGEQLSSESHPGVMYGGSLEGFRQKSGMQLHVAQLTTTSCIYEKHSG